jgi:aminoglycoside 6'-N-acetyltransferase I
MRWIFERAGEAYYFANSVNRTSHDLHVEFGFREVERPIWAPGVRFTDGEGVLYRADRPPA